MGRLRGDLSSLTSAKEKLFADKSVADRELAALNADLKKAQEAIVAKGGFTCDVRMCLWEVGTGQ